MSAMRAANTSKISRTIRNPPAVSLRRSEAVDACERRNCSLPLNTRQAAYEELKAPHPLANAVHSQSKSPSPAERSEGIQGEGDLGR